MRGDKFALPIGMYLPQETERPVCRSAPDSNVTSYHFYPVAGARRKPSQSRWTGLGAGAAGIRSTEYGYTKICTNEKQGANIPLLKVLESLENFFQEVFKRGLGQSPKVLGFGTASRGLRSYGLGRVPRSPTSKLFHSLWKSVWEKAKSGGKLLRDGGFRPVLRENGRKREEKSLWKNERLDFSARVMYNI